MYAVQHRIKGAAGTAALACALRCVTPKRGEVGAWGAGGSRVPAKVAGTREECSQLLSIISTQSVKISYEKCGGVHAVYTCRGLQLAAGFFT